MEQHIVLCGLGRVGWRVLELLRAAGLPVVAVDYKCQPDDPRLEGVRLVTGDMRRREVLLDAGVDRARGVLVLTGEDLLNVTVTLTVRALNPDVRVVMRMFNQNLLERLGKTVRNVFALSTSLLTAPILAVTALTGHGLGALRLDATAGGRRQMAEVQVGAGSALCGRTVAEAAAPRGVQVLAHLPAGGPERFLLEVDPAARLAAGDQLAVCGEPKAVAGLVADGNPAAPQHLLWAGWLWRMGRVAWRTLADVDRAVLICTGVLAAVIVFSTLLLHLGGTRLSVADALFRTVSVMATGASMGGDDYPSGWMKVYVAGLRLVGVALIASFTAIFTNYLLRARLSGALEVRRIPEGGHVVVCGLGPIGFRTVEELIGCGQQVVVIEVAADKRFVPTARRLGAAVIIGDAAVPLVLEQAHAASARAVIAATDNDLVNLEVALLVRGLNPAQRVVLLQSDPQLAQMLREGADVQLAVSAPALAAPAFVAGLFGDRVQSVFLVRGRMLAVIDLVVPADDAALTDRSVRALAIDYRLLPVALVPAEGPPPAQPLNARLAAGDRLIAITDLNDLQRLLRRQPASAEYAVEATACPLPMRGWLAGLLRTQRGLGQEEAEQELERLPCRVGEHLTRGQAEDLLVRLARERVAARLRPMQDAEGEAEEKAAQSPERGKP